MTNFKIAVQHDGTKYNGSDLAEFVYAFFMEEPNGLDATSESLILSSFLRFDPICSKQANETKDLDAFR